MVIRLLRSDRLCVVCRRVVGQVVQDDALGPNRWEPNRYWLRTPGIDYRCIEHPINKRARRRVK